jgi:hypothetical protein
MDHLTESTTDLALAQDPTATAPAPRETTNTDLAAALATLGIPRNDRTPLTVHVGDVEQATFYFQGISGCGKYGSAKMVEHWHDQSLHERHPRHALTYMRTALRNRARLIDYLHGRASAAITTRPGGQIEILTLRADRPPARALQPGAAAATRAPLIVADYELAAALLACGIPLDNTCGLPVQKNGLQSIFHFAPASPCGAFQTAPLTIAWQLAEWPAEHPEHPFAYISYAFENRRRLLKDIQLARKTAVFRKGEYHHFLELDAPDQVADRFFNELKKI